MKKSLAIHIDYGSRGNSGLYIHEILENIDANVCDVEAYVHSKYDYKKHRSTHLIFDKYSNFIPFKKLKQIYKLLDLYGALIFILIRVLFIRNTKVYLFVSLYEPFSIYKYLLKLVKNNKNVKTVATVHDAEPLFNNYPGIIMTDQNSIIHYADYLIVHTVESQQKLAVLNKKTFLIPFPLMRLERIESNKKEGDIQFLFIGYLRKEKGIDILIDAWEILAQKYKHIHLTIAGGVPFGLQYNFEKLNQCSLLLQYITEDQYNKLIADCHYAILPYTGGTNSGIVSTIASLNKPVITSDLPMFLESAFVLPQLIFKAHSAESLAQKLSAIIDTHHTNYNQYVAEIAIRNARYVDTFKTQLNMVYGQITQ